MRAWYFIAIVTALIPLWFRLTNRRALPEGPTRLASQAPPAGRRAMFLLLLGALGALVVVWSATPPLPE